MAAAVNCQKAGIDGVELHAAHGYLLGSFISPYTNKRTDEYGGSVQNCCRIVTEIINGIRAACGRYPICVRINGSDFVEGGITLAYAVEVAKPLAPPARLPPTPPRFLCVWPPHTTPHH